MKAIFHKYHEVYMSTAKTQKHRNYSQHYFFSVIISDNVCNEKSNNDRQISQFSIMTSQLCTKMFSPTHLSTTKAYFHWHRKKRSEQDTRRISETNRAYLELALLPLSLVTERISIILRMMVILVYAIEDVNAV